MSLPLEAGSAADIVLGPVFDDDGITLVNNLSHSDVTLHVYVGTAHTEPVLSGTNDADWWFRSSGNSDGLYFLRVPASFLLAADKGKALRITGLATGAILFENREVLQIIDTEIADDLATAAPFMAEYAEALRDIIALSDPTEGMAIIFPESTVSTLVANAITSAALATASNLATVASNVTTINGKADSIISKVDVVDGIVDAILEDTAEIENLASLDGTQVQAAAAAALAAYDPPTKAEMDSRFDAVDSAVGAIDVDANIDAEVIREAVLDALDEQLPDSVPPDGTRASVRQAVYMIVQHLIERSIEGGVMTIRKVDGVTPLITVRLNDSRFPTAITRES